MSRLLLIGGSDAGISAGLRAKQLNPATDVKLVLADRFPNYSICGLPFYISGETPDWHHLAHRTREDLEAQGLELLLDHRATRIDPQKKKVNVVDRQGRNIQLSFEKLIIGTGAEPIRPPIQGLDTDGVLVLHTMEDSFRVQEHIVQKGARRALIIGGGYIGLEMADALCHRGLEVTLVEQAEAVMTTVDLSLGQQLGEELKRHGVNLVTGVAIERIERIGDQIRLLGSKAFATQADLVLVVVGVAPSTSLASTAGVITGTKGAIRVNRRMETNLPDVFAAGDCVETWHRLLERATYLPLGTTAHKQGRVAGENAVGGNVEFQGSLGTQVVKVFDLAVARTGLRDAEAKIDGRFDPLTVETRVWDHKAYYPGAHELTIRVTGDCGSGRLLGAQIVGHKSAEVAKRIDIFAAALFHAMEVKAINDLDLSYTPPFSAPWDPVQVAAEAWVSTAHTRSR